MLGREGGANGVRGAHIQPIRESERITPPVRPTLYHTLYPLFNIQTTKESGIPFTYQYIIVCSH